MHFRGCTPTAVRPPRFPSKRLTSRPHFSKGARRGVCHYYYHYSSSATSTQRQQAHRRAGFRGCSRPQLNLFTPSSLSSLITSYYLIYMPSQSDKQRKRDLATDYDAYWTRPTRPQSAHFYELIRLSTSSRLAVWHQHVIVKRVCWDNLYLLYIIDPIKCSCLALVAYTTRAFTCERSVLLTQDGIIVLKTNIVLALLLL